MPKTLYIVPTPLGNLEDITLRALRVLREVGLIATEDTRTTGRLLKHFDIKCPMLSLHEHTGEARLEQILRALSEGDVALVSEAGTPLFSDPGYELVRAAIEREIDVVPLPGPSALTTALSASGLPPDKFCFYGFLPRKQTARQKLLNEVAEQRPTLVFFETPHRLRASLVDMKDILGAERPIAVCRELTKLYEEIWRGTLAEAQQTWQEREPRGEFTLVVAGAPEPAAWDQLRVEAALAEIIRTGESRKTAVQTVAAQSGWSKRAVYALAQEVATHDNFKK